MDPAQSWQGRAIDFTPTYGCPEAHSCEIIANCPLDGGNQRKVVLPPRGSLIVDCGFSVEIPIGYKVVISLTDHLADKGLTISSRVFIGNRRICVKVRNIGRELLVLEHGDRFANMAFEEIKRFEFEKE